MRIDRYNIITWDFGWGTSNIKCVISQKYTNFH